MNLNMVSKFGGVIDLAIKRNGGEVEQLGSFHNVIGSLATSNSRCYVDGSPTFYTQSASGEYSLSGTYIVENGVVKRSSGGVVFNSSYPTNGNLLKFGTGESAYRTTFINLSSFTISKPLNISTPTTIQVYKTNENGYGASASTGSIQSKGSNPYIQQYSNGQSVLSTINPIVFSISPVVYVLRDITVGFSSFSNFFTIFPELSVNIGDQIILNRYVYTVTFENGGNPIPFTNSNFFGVSSSGRYQRLTHIGTPCTSYAPAAIDILPTLSVISLSALRTPTQGMLSKPYIQYATIAPLFDVSSTALGENSNNNNFSQICRGQSLSALSGIKQLIVRVTTGNYVTWAIEFDDPITIDYGKVFELRFSDVFEQIV